MTGVIFLLTDHHLGARLAVSLMSLRDWYTGSVTLFTSKDSSHQLGRLLASDRRLNIEHRQLPHVDANNRHTAAYLRKATLLRHSPYARTIFLDADTLIVGPLDELVHSSSPITITPYGPWDTGNSEFSRRLGEWDDLLPTLPEGARFVQRQTLLRERPQPWINTGVFALAHCPQLIEEWEQLTLWGKDLSLPEEVAFQLALCGQDYELIGSHFNCIPAYPPLPPDVRIWHFAGESHLKHELGRSLWLPAWERCLAEDIGEVQQWAAVRPPQT